MGVLVLGAWPWLKRLPLVSGAVATTEGVALGVLEGVQDSFVDGTEVHAAMQSESFWLQRSQNFCTKTPKNQGNIKTNVSSHLSYIFL